MCATGLHLQCSVPSLCRYSSYLLTYTRWQCIVYLKVDVAIDKFERMHYLSGTFFKLAKQAVNSRM